MNGFVDIVLPIPLNNLFTYSVSQEQFQAIEIGMRLAVPFGKRKIYTGICVKKHHTPPLLYEAKEVFLVLDQTPTVNLLQLKHWQWISEYYVSPIGDVLRTALPSHLMLENETTLVLNNEFLLDDSNNLTDEEYLIFEALQFQPELTLDQVSKILDKKRVFPIVLQMIDKNCIKIKEHLKEKYKIKLQKYVKLCYELSDSELLNLKLKELEKYPKQLDLLMQYFVLKGQKKDVQEKVLLETCQVTSSVLNSLVKKNVLELYYLTQDRLDFGTTQSKELTLTYIQTDVVSQLKESWKTYQVTLLNAVTSSGKTEVYMSLIKEVISEGKQVLFLIPEIALTTQLVSRFKQFFGNQLVVFHSKYNNQERTESYLKVLQRPNEFPLIIGARSALFLPFVNLGLIVVDEEHESNYKQTNPSPRYHARDASIVLAKLHEAKVLLGTATPSFESYYNTSINKYGLVVNKTRYLDKPLPKIEFVSLKEAQKKKQMMGHFSHQLIDQIKEQLTNGRQVMLFQNRRGYAPILECESCGHIPMCPSCDVSLTYHSFKNHLRCHYCGYTAAKPTNCYACSSTRLTTKGFGTEQIELELASLFPKYNVGRMDHDTTKGKYNFESIINKFQNKEYDILVGTQMIAKGLDFGNVGLVGVLQADQLLYQPDFRSFERAFQMLLQVSGRAGRGNESGKVIIQTYHPELQFFDYVKNHDYESFYQNHLQERKDFDYPPFSKMIKIIMKCRDFNTLNQSSDWYCKSLKNVLQVPVLGPEEPLIGKIKNEFIKHILVKAPNGQSILTIKNHIKKVHNSFETIGFFKKVKVQINVDFY